MSRVSSIKDQMVRFSAMSTDDSHHGGIPPCRHCSNTGKECIIPAIMQDTDGPVPVKRKPPTSTVEGSLSSFKKSRYEAPGSGLPNDEIVKEALDVFFRVFYNDIFGCIHQPSFRTRMQEEPESTEPVLILAILTLSARFCKSILKDFENEAAASEYFCKRTLALFSPNIDKPSVVRIQAFLMIGLHLWGASQGPSAWIYVGIAIRMIQVLELGSAQSYPTTKSNSEWIALEERRRTFWSAYLMDRMMSNGRGRPQTISNQDITIPLPADNVNFTFGTPEAILYLGQAPSQGTLRPECTGTLASLIELVDLWSRMAKWSCARKWLTDELAPWDPASEFYQVTQLLEQWRSRLPRSLQLDNHTTMIQLSQKNSNWALMWMVYNNGLLSMHRSYLTFAPSRLDPRGPKEAADRGWVEPAGFWRNSATASFIAAEQIIDLNQKLVNTENVLVTPMALFSIFSAGIMMAYLVSFPWMDHEQKVAPRARTLCRIASDYLKSVQSTWRMVANWVETLAKISEVHAKFAQEGRFPSQNEDHFAEYRSKVLDFGHLHQVQEPYGRDTYNSSLRTGAQEPQRPVGRLETNGNGVSAEAQHMQSIHEGALSAFMQGNDWDLLTDDWLSNLGLDMNGSNQEGTLSL